MSDGFPLLALLLSFLATAIPTAFWSWLVWWCDRYEREPGVLLASAFLWGAFPAVALSLVVELPLGLEPRGRMAGLLGAGAVPVVEELSKGLALLLISRLARSEFDDVLDGLLYGALIGFGFAMTENFIYFLGALSEGGWGTWGAVVFLRSVVFGLNHAFFTAFTGAGLGYAAMARSRWRRIAAPLLGLGVAIAMHGVHNLGSALAEELPAAILMSLVNDAGGVLLVVAMIVLALRQERMWLRSELASEVGRLLSGAELAMLESPAQRGALLARARRAGGWRAVASVARFQRLATELAFCKYRARTVQPDTQLRLRMARLEDELIAARAEAGLRHLDVAGPADS